MLFDDEAQEQFKDELELLGIISSDTIDTIKKKYRQLCLKYHPDKNPKNRDAAEIKFKAISEAYLKIEIYLGKEIPKQETASPTTKPKTEKAQQNFSWHSFIHINNNGAKPMNIINFVI